jgi:type IV pilus assembly protein PilE
VTDFIIRPMPECQLLHAVTRRQRGFTLVELMAVVVVIAILAAIALPAYTEYVRKSRRAEAITLLNRVAQEQERWRANNVSYTTDRSAAGINVADPSSGYYTLSIPAAAASSFTAIAIAAGAQVSDTKCTRLGLVMEGGNMTYAASGTATAAQCWSR